MSDDEYKKKLEDLQEYVPYLENLISALQNPNSRNKGPQLEKMQSLYDIITNKSRKYKVDTLRKCEEVLHKIQNSAKPEKAQLSDNDDDGKLSVKDIMDAVKLGLARDKLQTCGQTPKSPSPDRENITEHRPIVIPTEKVTYREIINPRELTVVPPRKHHKKVREERYNEEKPNIYSSAAESLSSSPKKPVISPLKITLPDISKPPLTDADLEMLTSDDFDLKSQNDYKNQNRKDPFKELEELQRKSATNVKSSTPHRPKPKDEKHKEKEKGRSERSDKTDKSEKVIKESSSKFGSLLSSIDDKIIKEKSCKKREKRLSSDKVEKAEKSHPKENKSKEVLVDIQESIHKRLAHKYNPKPKPNIDIDSFSTAKSEQKPDRVDSFKHNFSGTSTYGSEWETSLAPDADARHDALVLGANNMNNQYPTPNYGNAQLNPFASPIPNHFQNHFPNFSMQNAQYISHEPNGFKSRPNQRKPNFNRYFQQDSHTRHENVYATDPRFKTDDQYNNYCPNPYNYDFNTNFRDTSDNFQHDKRTNFDESRPRDPRLCRDLNDRQQQSRPKTPFHPPYKTPSRMSADITSPRSGSETPSINESPNESNWDNPTTRTKTPSISPPNKPADHKFSKFDGKHKKPDGRFSKPDNNKFSKFNKNKFSKPETKFSKPDTRFPKSNSKANDPPKTVYDDIYTKLDSGKKEVFYSPLESLYASESNVSSSRGYGVQKFKIPKKPKPVEVTPEPMFGTPAAEEENWDAEIDSSRTFATQKVEEDWDAEIDANRGFQPQVEEEENWDAEIEQNRKLQENLLQNDVNDENYEDSFEIEETVKKPQRRRIIESSDEDDDELPQEKVIVKTKSESKNNKDKALNKGIRGLSEGTLNKADFMKIVYDILGEQQHKKMAKIQKILQSDESSEDDGEVVIVPVIQQKTDTEKTFDEAVKQLKAIRGNKKSKAKMKKDNANGEELVYEAKKVLKHKRKSELDKLHDDIKEVMGDRINQAPLKRLCTVQKSSSNEKIKPVTTEVEKEHSEPPSETSFDADEEELEESSRRLRSKTRNLRVLVEKTDISTIKNVKINNADVEASDAEKTTKQPKKNVKKKSPVKRPNSSNAGKEWDTSETDITDNDLDVSKETFDSNSLAGEDSEEVSNITKNIKRTANIVQAAEHDIDHYYRPGVKVKCMLCNHKNVSLTSHYNMMHGDYEILISRFHPEVAKEAISQSRMLNLENLEPFEMLSNNKRTKFSFSCRFCSLNYHKEVTEVFYNHLTIHTGEFRNRCSQCRYASSTVKNLKLHIAHKHTNTPIPAPEPPPLNYKYVFGYMCSQCNFVQLHRENLEKHIALNHGHDQAEIVKISMSEYRETIEPEDDIETTINEQATNSNFLDMNVFTCDADLNLDDSKLLENRLEKMNEISNSIKPTRSSIAAVLQSKLENVEDIMPKVELPEIDSLQLVAKEEKIEVDEAKQILNTSATIVPKSECEVKKLLRTDFIVIHVKQDSVLYTCIMPKCAYFSEDAKAFEDHCKSHEEPVHLNCNICNVKMEHEGPNVTLLECFYHLKTTHLDCKFDPLLELKKEPLESVMGSPVFKAADNLAITFKLSSVESQGKKVFDIDLTGVKTKEEAASPPPAEHADNAEKTSVSTPPVLVPIRPTSVPIVSTPIATPIRPISAPSVATPIRPSLASISTAMGSIVTSMVTVSTPQGTVLAPLVTVSSPSSSITGMSPPIGTSPIANTSPFKISPVPLNTLLANPPPNISVPATTASITVSKPSAINRVAVAHCQSYVTHSNQIFKNKSASATKVLLQLNKVTHLYKCVVFDCCFSTNDMATYQKHLPIHGNVNRLYPCIYCVEALKLGDIPAHLRDIHGPSNYYCGYCLYKGIYINYAKSHQRIQHPEKEVNVYIGNSLNVSAVMLEVPVGQQFSLYECGEDGCGKKFFGLEEFRDHMEEELKGKMVIKCYVCKDVFMRVSTFLNHIHTMHTMHTFVCGICSSGTNSLRGTYIHIVQNHNFFRPMIVLRKLKAPLVLENDIPKNKLVDIILKNAYVFPRDFHTSGDLDLTEFTSTNSEFARIKQELADPLEKISNFKKVFTSDEFAATMAEEPQAKEPEELYKCAYCSNISADVYQFRQHSLKCNNGAQRSSYLCYHCKKTFKTLNSLSDHMNQHAPPRFQCSICMQRKRLQFQLKVHMKKEHKVSSVVVVPIDPNKKDVNKDYFILRPTPEEKQVQLQIVEKNSTLEAGYGKLEYQPSEIEQLPRSAIFLRDLKCAVCGYTSKVRMNMVRHLQFHSVSVEVPTSAPVNPVPCLEKNEKMFDKMTNLAGSSHPVGRMSSSAANRKPSQEDEDAPIYIAETKRYVCGAENCDYLCLEESMLRRHLQALHSNEQEYKCQHCDLSLTSTEKLATCLDSVMKHYRLHDSALYKCPYCKFLHNLKHKMERHVCDKHSDQHSYYITLREPAAEPSNKDLLKDQQKWKCGLCKTKRTTREDIVAHVKQMHNIDAQFKCAFCTVVSEETGTFRAHFNENHAGCTVDIITAYYKEEDLSKVNEQKELFDTTPIWSRDKPRIKHIRGILLEESGKIPKKSQLKLSTDLVQRLRDDLAETAAAEEKNPKKSAADKKAAINGDKKPPKLVREGDSALQRKRSFDSDSPVKTYGKKPRRSCTMTSLDEPPKLEMIVQQEDVTVIESDDDQDVDVEGGTETLLKIKTENKESKKKMPPLIPLMQPSVTNTNDDVSLAETSASINDSFETNLSEEALDLLQNDSEEIGTFGPYGKPLDGHYFCPLCNEMRSKTAEEFIKHLYKELEYARFRCAVCKLSCISHAVMKQHISKSHGEGDGNKIISMPENVQIETWVRKVVEVQKKLIEEDEREPLLIPLSSCIEDSDEQKLTPPAKKKKKNMVPCKQCGLGFPDVAQLRDHQKSHNYKYECRFCEFRSNHKPGIMSHMRHSHRVIHSEADFDECIRTFDFSMESDASESSTTDSVPIRTSTPLFTDPSPSPTVPSPSSISTVSSTSSAPPPEAWKPLFKNRMPRISLDKSVFKCKYCDCMSYYNILKIHHNFNHKQQKFQPYKYYCSDCNLYLLKLSDIKDHMVETHTDREPSSFYSIFTGDTKLYKCSICGASYENIIALRLHIKNKFQCGAGRILRQEADGSFADALQSDFVNFLTIANKSVPSPEGVPASQTARKSTTTRPAEKPVDLSKIMTTIETMGVSKTMSVKEFAETVDIFPMLVLENCEDDLQQS